MQKLEERNTYTPTNASQVRGNCDSLLNKEDTLSVTSLKTSFNNSEVNQPKHEEQDSRVLVYVLNIRGQPLMPTNPTKAKHLLKLNKAKVIKRTPFTIQLKYATGETKQPITLGIDSGYSTIGFSATTKTQELISGELQLRIDITKKLQEKKMYRKLKRNKLWYRPARFLNRKIPKGWLAPSIKHKLDTHINLINKIKKLLPITNTIVEVSSFDTQKMVNPEISGIEYQQGTLKGYEVREYLLEKFQRKCAYCKKENVPLEIEHITSSSRGGSNRVSNLTLACHKCNQDKGNMTAKEFGFPDIQKQALESLKSTAFMNTIRWKLVNILQSNHTYGYITKHNRIKFNLEKSHINDAFVISKGTNQYRSKSLSLKQSRRNNRTLQTNRKGYKPSIRKQRYKIQPNDLVLFKPESKICISGGVHSYGKRVYLIDSNKNKFSTNIKNIELIKYGKGIQI